jgi:hypothetical protein
MWVTSTIFNSSQRKQSPNGRKCNRPIWPPCFAFAKGDQVGRIFAHKVIVYFGHFVENCRSCPKRVNLIHGKNYATFRQKNGLGFILGDFFSQTHLVTLHSCKHGLRKMHSDNVLFSLKFATCTYI